MVHLVRQDLSIAGKRAGLAGARSGLFMEQIRIIKEMRTHDADTGRTGQFLRPRYMVWENVPGALSSNKGKDFAAVLEETIRIAEPEAPSIEVPEKGWPTWGGYRDMDGRWSVYWRVLDAQYFGVPQRRRRIALVADFGGCTAPEILFERSGVHGHSAQSGTAGEGTSAAAENGADDTSGSGIDCKTPWETQSNRVYSSDGKWPALSARENGGQNREAVYCLQGNGIDRSDTAGCNGKGWREDVSYTLNTIDRPAVCKPQIFDIGHRCDAIRECGNIVPTMTARMGTGGNQVPVTSSAKHFFASERFEAYKHSKLASTECARQHKGHSDLIAEYATSYANFAVRRLTPLECERLQGMPDYWTDIGAWRDEKGKLHKESSDAARYKAIGNSIAIPPWKWVLKRLCAQYERDATMGSLFDGLGCFPLVWTQLNGWGSVKWASEIEPFCIAVTKRHFGDEETGERGDMWEYLTGGKKHEP